MIKEIMKTAIVAVLFAFLLNIYYGEAEVIPDLFSTSYKQEVSKIVNSADSKHPKNIGKLKQKNLKTLKSLSFCKCK